MVGTCLSAKSCGLVRLCRFVGAAGATSSFTIDPGVVQGVVCQDSSKDDLLYALKLRCKSQESLVRTLEQILASVLLKHGVLKIAQGQVSEAGTVHSNSDFKISLARIAASDLLV